MVVEVQIFSSEAHRGTTYYSIRVRQNASQWVVKKRYSDFQTLDSHLDKSGWWITRLELPEKGSIGFRHRMNIGEFNKLRQASLGRYLGHLVKQIKMLSQHPALMLFFEVERRDADRAAEDVREKCELINDAIHGADSIPESARAMLGGLLSMSLSVPKNERHVYQSQAVDMVGQALKDIEASLRACIDKAEASIPGVSKVNTVFRLGQTSGVRSLMELVTTTDWLLADSALAEKTAVAEKQQKVLDEALRVKTAQKQALDDADAAWKTADAELEELMAKKLSLQSAEKDNVVPLWECAVRNKSQRARCISQLSSAAKEAGMDASLLAALQVVLSKESADRGSYDAAVLKQWESSYPDCIQHLDQAITIGQRRKLELAAAVESGKKAYAVEDAAYQACAASNSRAQAAHKEVNEAVQKLDAARERLAEFRRGPLMVFKELEARTVSSAEVSRQQSAREVWGD